MRWPLVRRRRAAAARVESERDRQMRRIEVLRRRELADAEGEPFDPPKDAA